MWETDDFDRREFAGGFGGGYRRWRRRSVVKSVDDRESGRALLIPVGRGVVIMMVASRMSVAAMLVAVIADVEVEVEEAGAELAMPVPIAGGVEAETADEDQNNQTKGRSGSPEDPNHGSAKTLHLEAPR